MVPQGYWLGYEIENFHKECRSVKTKESKRAEIVDTKYGKSDVDEVIKKQEHLEPSHKEELRELLKAKMNAFQGT